MLLLSERQQRNLLAKIEVTGFCWSWTSPLNPGGYGTFRVGKQGMRMAHRVVYEWLVSDIPEGLELDHLCRNTACVNPDHLEPVTPQVNSLRAFGLARAQVQRTHCPKGHEYNEENTRPYKRKSGTVGRVCRTCEKIRQTAPAYLENARRKSNERYHRNKKVAA